MMMAIEGQERVLTLVTTRELLLKLFINDVQPTRTTPRSAYQEPKHGYSQKVLSPANWQSSAERITYPEVLFSFSEKIGDVYGAFLVFKSTGELLGAERFDRPVPIATANHQLMVTVNLTLA